MTTGQTIYECRKRAGMTQEELAEKLGVSRQAVSKWESDAAFPETDNILELCKLFHISADALLFGKENGAEQEDKAEASCNEPSAAPEADGKGVTWGLIPHAGKYCFEYVSRRRFLGLPLLHVHFGAGLCRAHGVFAFGNFASGFVSAGFFSAGFFSVGLFAVGLLALGNFVMGCLALGSIAAGILAFGAVTIGMIAYGAVAIGNVAIGAMAIGQYAVGDWAQGFLAVARTTANGTHVFYVPEMIGELTAFAEELPKWASRLVLRAASSF